MTVTAARTWIIAASLSVTAVLLMFFFVAPAVGYPLEPGQALQLLEITGPVFLGYLGSASHFLFKARRAERRLGGTAGQLSLLVRGPIAVFALATASLFFAFGYSNRLDAAPDTGMSFEALSGGLTATVGLLAVTTGVISAYLFADTSAGK